jgi:hypothetical protein
MGEQWDQLLIIFNLDGGGGRGEGEGGHVARRGWRACDEQGEKDGLAGMGRTPLEGRNPHYTVQRQKCSERM